MRNNYYSPKRRAIMARGEQIDHTEVFNDHGWVCHLCEQDIDQTATRDDPMRVTLDHIIPLSRGGQHIKANVAPAHYRCNMVKGNTLPNA